MSGVYDDRVAPALGYCVVLAVRLAPARLRDPVLASVLGIASRRKEPSP